MPEFKWRKDRPTFEIMDLPFANSKCGKRFSKATAYYDTCERCDKKVVIHCPDCQIQVSGCLCTMYEQMGDDQFKEALSKMGMWMKTDG